jgi:hypothetical protein
MRCLSFIALLVLAVAPARAADPQTVDTLPNLPLQRNTGAGLGSGWVYALVAHPQGGMIVGGDFVRAGAAPGEAHTYLLRVLPDGTLDPNFATKITSNGALDVQAIAATADAIYIGGTFQKVDDQARVGLAKLDLQGHVVAGWSSDLAGSDVVHSLAVGGGRVYVGGYMSTNDIWGLARYDEQTGARDTRWRAQTQTQNRDIPPDPGLRGHVYSVLYTGNDLIVGGNFEKIAGVGRRFVARLSLQQSDTNVAVLPYAVNLSGNVYSLAHDAASGQVYVGGRFFVGQRDNLVRTAADGTIDDGFQPDPADEVSAMLLARGRLYYGGNFRVDAATPLYLARTSIAGDGAPDPNWLPLPDNHVKALAWQGAEQRLWLGGKFTQTGAAPRLGLARISFAGQGLVFRDGFED